MSRAFGNLENRLLNEINHLKIMLNFLLPPMYQQHYFGQPQPQLYQPLQVPTPSSVTPATAFAKVPIETTTISQIQNESPMVEESPAIIVNDTLKPNQTNNFTKNTTISNLKSNETISTTTERILEFRPVQKKQNRTKTTTKLDKIYYFII